MTYFRVEVSHGTVWVLAAVVIKHLLEVVHVVLGRDDCERSYQVEHRVLHGDLLKNHFVLSQSAGLVSEQVLNAAQLLGDGRVARYGAVDFSVLVDAVGVVDLRHVQVDSEGDGDDVGEEQYKAEELDDPLALELVERHHYQRDEDHHCEEALRHPVELEVQLPHLGLSVSRVHHGASLDAGVDNETQDKPWRGKHGVSPQSVLQAQTFSLEVIVVRASTLVVTLEVVDLVIGWIGDDMAAHCDNALRRLSLRLRNGLPELPISLSVELVRSDEYCAAPLSSVEQHQVSRYPLVVVHLDDVAYLQFS